MKRAALLQTLLVLIGLAGCRADHPMINGDEWSGAEGRYADTVIAYSAGDEVVSCTDGLAECDESLVQPVCVGSAVLSVLGPPDGKRFDLAPRSTLRIALRCGLIRDHEAATGSSTPDFRIAAVVAPGAQAVVSASLDGNRFEVVDRLRSSDQVFDLTRIHLTAARYLEIVDGGGGGIAIDAVEAL